MPQHLMELIIKELHGFNLNRSLACMRLVSKSWLAAVTAHPGNLQLDSVENQRDLLQLCKLLPNMGGLEFSTRRMKLNLKALSTLSGLSHLSLVGVRGKKEELSADISVLPRSLKELHLKSVHMPPECFQSLQCVDLTSLSLHYGRNEEEDVHELLQHLPKLKVVLTFCLCIDKSIRKFDLVVISCPFCN